MTGGSWPKEKLGRTAQIGNGSTPRRDSTTYWGGGDFPWLNSSVVNESRVTQAEQFVTAAALRECHLPVVAPGSVLVGLTGQGKTRGMATILEIEATLNQHVAYVTPDRSRWFPEYLLWSLTASYDELRFLSEENGSTKGGLTCEALKQFRLTVPPLGYQRAVCNYLNRETSRIDTLIEEQLRLIEMLRERRDSAWAERVDMAYQFGQITSIRRVIESIVDGPFGSSLTSAHYSDKGARVIRLGNIGVNEFRGGDSAFIPLDYAAELEVHAVERGDVVVAGLGDDRMPLGRAAVVPDLGPAIVKADCYRLRPNSQISAAYLAWVLSAPQTRSQIMLLARGSTRARLNTKVVQQVEIPLPNREVQDDLVGQSEAESAKIDVLIAEAGRFIELARERRAALITAAVMGQIDVQETA